MQKPFYSALYILSLLSAGLTIHQAFAQRSPSVEPITEISIEENRPARAPGQVETGFDFSDKKIMAPTAPSFNRVPANIATKTSSSPYSNVGPLIFLFALPVALWIVISKKMKNVDGDKKVAYYSKNSQFKPSKDEYQEQEDIDDEQDYPKAS